MKQEIQNCRRFVGGTIQRLPDGRRLVSEFNKIPKVIDTDGIEVAPSPSEVEALIALAGMIFPRKMCMEKR